jgi:peptidoglycan/xylan/chitin deacetylase (PgdA/CDA1 family)
LGIGLLVTGLISGALFYFLPPKSYIPVLNYHFIVPKKQVGPTSLDVSVEHFDAQMWFLKTFGFRPITIDEFYLIKSGRIKPKGKEILVTFDDGNETYLQYALPILERYQIPSVNFLVWDFLVRKEHGSMSLDDAKQYAQHPLISFGSHSMTHPKLIEISLDQAQNEINQSKINLENALRKPISYFVYPSGLFNEDISRLTKEADYLLAFTTGRKRLKGKEETLFTLTRIKVHPKDNLLIFYIYLTGLYDLGKRIDLFFHQLTGYKQSDKLNLYESAQKAM